MFIFSWPTKVIGEKKMTPTFPNNMLYQANSGSLVGSHYHQQNQQNHVGPNNNLQTYNMIDQATAQNVSQSNLQPHNEEYALYHRQLAQNHAMALAQLLIPGAEYEAKESIPKLSSQNQLQMSHDDRQININYAIEQNFVTSQNIASSAQSGVSNLVNQKPPVYTKWTEQEDELLRGAVRIYGPHKWSLIATHVPNRTPMQCSARWVGALNPSILKGRWTSQEDNALKEAVSHYINSVDSQGNPQPIPWNKVSKRIPQRTGAQCQARWTEALDPRIRKVTNDESNNMLTPPNTTPSTPAQRIKSVTSSSPDIIQGVILRSSPQTMTNTSPTSYGTLESPISNQSVSSGQSPTISDPATPISSPEFSNYVVDTNSFQNCNMHFNNSASENPLLFYNGAYNQAQPYIEQYNNEITYLI
ncbi:16232_t:CDS:2 [Funneliformis mosseae]|uniref:16232_t:CDS:1 n=1 Tax=Funneliformis mosseae TaxID=27381 RepID=A0A9N9A267_FUNMO|nr:16232_t:CDS:2 [Funneliformis mosseae]